MTFGSTFGRVFSPTFQPHSISGGKFKPTDISGCKLWLDFADPDTMFTDDGSTKVSNDSDLIYRINDKSGNGNHATQTNSAYRPAYKQSIQNGNSAGYATPKNSKAMSHAYPLGTATDFTVFIAANFAELFDYTGLIGTGWSGGITINNRADGVWEAGTDVANRIGNYSGAVANSDFVLNLTKNGSNSGNLRIQQNNNTPGFNTGKTAKNPTANTITVFGATPISSVLDRMVGYFYEYIIYNYALSDSDRSKVQTYLNNKWAIY